MAKAICIDGINVIVIPMCVYRIDNVLNDTFQRDTGGWAHIIADDNRLEGY